MKENSLVKITNVRKAEKMFQYLEKRPKTEMVGLGLIYGMAGLGKTRFARQTSINNGYVYLRLEATMNIKAFTLKLLERVNFHFGIPFSKTSDSTNKVFDRVINILQDVDDVVIVIDEIDYAFKSEKIFGAIRDIVDLTLCTVVLVGMADAKQKLLTLDSHYFDRCNYFCEFHPLNESDVKQISDEIIDVKLQPGLIKFITEKTKGNIRKLIKTLYSIENMALEKSLDEIKIEHLSYLE